MSVSHDIDRISLASVNVSQPESNPQSCVNVKRIRNVLDELTKHTKAMPKSALYTIFLSAFLGIAATLAGVAVILSASPIFPLAICLFVLGGALLAGVVIIGAIYHYRSKNKPEVSPLASSKIFEENITEVEEIEEIEEPQALSEALLNNKYINDGMNIYIPCDMKKLNKIKKHNHQFLLRQEDIYNLIQPKSTLMKVASQSSNDILAKSKEKLYEEYLSFVQQSLKALKDKVFNQTKNYHAHLIDNFTSSLQSEINDYLELKKQKYINPIKLTFTNTKIKKIQKSEIYSTQIKNNIFSKSDKRNRENSPKAYLAWLLPEFLIINDDGNGTYTIKIEHNQIANFSAPELMQKIDNILSKSTPVFQSNSNIFMDEDLKLFLLNLKSNIIDSHRNLINESDKQQLLQTQNNLIREIIETEETYQLKVDVLTNFEIWHLFLIDLVNNYGVTTEQRNKINLDPVTTKKVVNPGNLEQMEKERKRDKIHRALIQTFYDLNNGPKHAKKAIQIPDLVADVLKSGNSKDIIAIYSKFMNNKTIQKLTPDYRAFRQKQKLIILERFKSSIF